MSWKLLLSPPEVSDVERGFLLDAFDSGWIAPAGPDLDAFEAELADFTGAASVVGLSTGTAAIHLALTVVGVQAGDDVLVSDLTFGASAFAVTYVGARPVFVDCEPHSWHLDPDLLATELARRARAGTLPAAVVAVDLYGSVADHASIAPVCAEYGVPLVEDAAEALGARRHGMSAGRFGDVGVLSFNGNKILTTGGGGALLSDDPSLVTRARYLATQARQPVAHYEHTDVGFNYRMGNLNAAVGRGQLRTLPARIGERRRVRLGYERLLGALPGIGFQQVPPDCSPNHWLTTITVDAEQFGATATDVLAALHAAGIEARPGFKPMHLQPVFAGAGRVGGGVSAGLFERSVSLPSGGRITDEQVAWVADVVAGARGG
jgi:dTDP-4-amino-4,6-dideoxygalactose transaminase